MNYRHAYHAGNFADIFKHIILTRILAYLQLKDAPLRVMDLHGGSGLYSLDSHEAQRTGEWHGGLEKFWMASAPAALDGLLSPFRQAVAHFNPNNNLQFYPGSPLIAASMLRPQDKLAASELHPDDFLKLQSCCRDFKNVSVHSLDAQIAIKSFLPPVERRGLVLLDPPFEVRDEFDRLEAMMLDGLARWQSGCFMIWYVLKNRQRVHAFEQTMQRLMPKDMLVAEFHTHDARHELDFSGCGVLVLSPPYVLKNDLSQLLPWLCSVMGEKGQAHFRLDAFSQ